MTTSKTGEIIEGELDVPRETSVAHAPEAQAVKVFNPLDAEPLTFSQGLQRRQDNYDSLQMHLRSVLVPGKDFGRIHVKKDCDNKWNCTNDYHFSAWTLFAPGADKILGLLGLAVHYPDMQDYKRATLKGLVIKEVIADCQVIGHNGQVIAEGAGACSREELQFGGLNAVIKRACKRARLDAVSRLPVVSALFESDFLAQIAQEGASNSTAKRSQRVNETKKWILAPTPRPALSQKNIVASAGGKSRPTRCNGSLKIATTNRTLFGRRRGSLPNGDLPPRQNRAQHAPRRRPMFLTRRIRSGLVSHP